MQFATNPIIETTAQNAASAAINGAVTIAAIFIACGILAAFCNKHLF